MRMLFSGLMLAGALTLAGPAGALPYTGTFVAVVDIALAPILVDGSGSGDPSLPAISANTFVGAGSVGVTGHPPITQIFVSLTGNAAGAVGSGPSIGGTGIAGGSGFGTGLPLISLRLTSRLGFASGLATPVHSGASGSASAHFGAWTTGVATVMRTHTLGSAACVASSNSAGCPTAMLGGATANANYFGGAAQIVLVAPVDLYTTTGGIGGIPTFTLMALNYVPEPGSLLLLGSGVVGLAWVGRRRMRV